MRPVPWPHRASNPLEFNENVNLEWSGAQMRHGWSRESALSCAHTHTSEGDARQSIQHPLSHYVNSDMVCLNPSCFYP